MSGGAGVASLGSEVFLCLRWREEFVGQFDDEPNTFIYEVNGNIVAIDGMDDPVAGWFALTYVDIDGAVDAGAPLFLLMDAKSQSLHEYSIALLDPYTYYFNRRVQKAVGSSVEFGGNLLILDRLELLPRYRGKGKSLTLIREMIRRFHHGAEVVAIKPFPLQLEVGSNDEVRWRALELDAMSKDESAATRKLVQHYSKCGFRKVAKTPYMALSPTIFESR